MAEKWLKERQAELLADGKLERVRPDTITVDQAMKILERHRPPKEKPRRLTEFRFVANLARAIWGSQRRVSAIDQIAVEQFEHVRREKGVTFPDGIDHSPVAPVAAVTAMADLEVISREFGRLTKLKTPDGAWYLRENPLARTSWRGSGEEYKKKRRIAHSRAAFRRLMSPVELDGVMLPAPVDQAGEIRVFEPDGSHLRTIARAGEGPGELQDPTGMEWGPGNRLWVEDTDNNRYSGFDTTGAFETSFPRKSNWFGYAWSGRFDDDGFLYLEQHQFAPDGRVDQLAKFDTTMTLLDTFPLPTFDAPAYELMRVGRVRTAVNIPFSPRLAWTVAPDGTLWFGISDEYRLYQRTPAGDTLRIVERAFDPIPVTAEERATRLEADFYERMREQGADIDPGRIPEYHPAWNGFSVGPEGYLWVVPEVADGPSTPIDVFDPSGRYLGRLTLDATIRPLYPGPLVRGDHLYGIAQDELGGSYVVRAPLRPEAPRG